MSDFFDDMSLAVSEPHAALLTESAIADDVARARQYRTITNDKAALELVVHGFRHRRAGLLIPLYSVGGEMWGYQLRSDTPRRKPGPDGGPTKTVKYETPTDQDVRLDVPPYVRNQVRDKREPLIVTEGSRKADAAASAGWAAVAVLGVSMWHCPDWDQLRLRDRKVYLAFDSDSADNRQVNVQLRKLTRHLRGLGAKVASFVIPPGDDDSKVGLDDYLAAGGTIDQLVDEAVEDAAPVVTAPQGDGREPLDITNEAKFFDWLRVEIGRGVPGLFLRGDQLVRVPRIGEDGYVPPDDEADEGPAQVRPVTGEVLAALVQSQHWTYGLSDKAGLQTATHKMVPGNACNRAVAVASDSKHLPRLAGVVHTPLVRAPGGDLLDTPGYDAKTKLLYLPTGGLIVPRVPTRPTRKDVAAARDLLLYMVADFPFATPHDRANFLGAMLMPLLRVASPGLRPLVVINAPQQGSGKSLLAHLLRIVHGGVMRPEMPTDDDELRKQITSVLLTTTGPVVHFDNVTKTVRSGGLAALLTGATWTDRVLSKSQDVTLPNDRLWVLTGNNVSLGGDLGRRALWVTLDANTPRPWDRGGFVVPNLTGWAEEHRGELIAALLTLVRAWVTIKKNRPMPNLRGADNFAELARRVAGVLQVANIEGEFWHRDTERAVVGADDEVWAGFLAALAQDYGDRLFTAKQVIDGFGSGIEEHAPAELVDKWDRAVNGSSVALSLGMWFKNREGRYAGTYAVRSAGQKDGSKLWRVVAAESSEVSGD